MADESTTPDLVELTRGFFEAAGQSDLDAVMSFFAPDAVWEMMSLGSSFEGVAAIRGFFEDWTGAYQEFEIEMDEALDLSNGVVFAVTRLVARPGGRGSPLMRRRPVAFTWVGSLIARVTAYADSIEDGRAAAERLAESRE
jgi:ketosteroid isomerase-like protein